MVLFLFGVSEFKALPRRQEVRSRSGFAASWLNQHFSFLPFVHQQILHDPFASTLPGCVADAEGRGPACLTQPPPQTAA